MGGAGATGWEVGEINRGDRSLGKGESAMKPAVLGEALGSRTNIPLRSTASQGRGGLVLTQVLEAVA